ncbi:MAG TPA: hypothetical protein VF988_17760 [Verrucomicrobiae bacterium]
MRISWRLLPLAALAALPLLVSGCGGFSASRTISPLDFLLPGIGGMGGIIRADPPQTNAPVVLIKDGVEIASVR